ncbi:hypothetical protein [uncultured Massilia sp.]|nr:hypothetical protein [uncultured Massilia sp.]
MKLINRLFATAFVALLLFASHSRVDAEESTLPAFSSHKEKLLGSR